MSPEQSPQSDPAPVRARSRPFALLATAATLTLAAVLVIAVACGGSGDKDSATATPNDPFHAGLATGEPVIEATIDLNRETGQATNLTELGPDDRMAISKFGINGELKVRKVGADGSMPDPETPDEITYYDFSDWPGLGGAPGRGGNAVFAAHVDSGSKPCDNGRTPAPCLAIFAPVRNLKLGDVVELHIGGDTFRYSVTANDSVNAVTADWQKIVASTAEEMITLITCGGNFNTSTREYDARQVVTAVRIP